MEEKEKMKKEKSGRTTSKASPGRKTVVLTFDVEEWFQVENLKGVIDRSEWEKLSSSVEKNTRFILNMLRKLEVPATFFILGWVAERHPSLVKEIQRSGHEVACHGYGHQLAYDLGEQELREDISRAKEILDDIVRSDPGKLQNNNGIKKLESEVAGFRAPNFSINDKILGQLKDLGFIYDSSYNPFQLHNRYGSLNGLGEPVQPDCYLTDQGIFEIPISTWSSPLGHIPIGGGGYFRIFPFRLFKKWVMRKIENDSFYSMYLHPWEFEPEQQRVKGIRIDYRFRHYYGLRKTGNRLENLMQFLNKNNCEFMTMRQYVDRVRNKKR